MAYWQWGASESSHVVLCVHGLTRQGRDFDVLAQALVAQAQRQGRSVRVVCPDVVGRGQSDWLSDASLYQPLTYVAHLHVLLAHLHTEAPVHLLDWVGTSMGGLIGMLAAVQPQAWPSPIRRLVLNDVGPSLEWAGLERIRGYVGQGGSHASLAEGAEALRRVLVGFGPHTEAQWLALSEPMFKAGVDGRLVLHYDPAIAHNIRTLTPELHAQSSDFMRAVYEQIRCEVLLLRGAQSELLSQEAALAMGQCGPRAHLIEIPGVGHAPTLVADDQVQPVRDFIFQP